MSDASKLIQDVNDADRRYADAILALYDRDPHVIVSLINGLTGSDGRTLPLEPLNRPFGVKFSRPDGEAVNSESPGPDGEAVNSESPGPDGADVADVAEVRRSREEIHAVLAGRVVDTLEEFKKALRDAAAAGLDVDAPFLDGRRNPMGHPDELALVVREPERPIARTPSR